MKEYYDSVYTQKQRLGYGEVLGCQVAKTIKYWLNLIGEKATDQM